MGNVFYGVQSYMNSMVYTIGQYYDHPTDLKDTVLCSKNQGPGFVWLYFVSVVYPDFKEYTIQIIIVIMV